MVTNTIRSTRVDEVLTNCSFIATSVRDPYYRRFYSINLVNDELTSGDDHRFEVTVPQGQPMWL